MLKVDLPKHRELYDAFVQEIDRLEKIESPGFMDTVDLNLLRILKNYFDETFQVLEEKHKPLVWTGECFTPEIFLAMDLHPYVADLIGNLLYSMDQEAVAHYLSVSENAGLPPEMCTNVRNNISVLLSGELPKPDLFAATGLPCDNLVMSVDIYRNYYPDVPTFVLDAPFGNDEEDIAYYTQDIKNMVKFIEEHTGRKLDYDRLREILTITNQGYNLVLEVCELRKAVPTPQTARLLGLQGFLDWVAAGKPEYAAFYKPIVEDAKEKVKKGIGVVENEKHRTIWFHNAPIFDLSIYSWMEENLGVTIPMDMLGYVQVEPIDLSTPESMLRWLAMRSLNFPMARQLRGSVELYTDDLIRICDEYKADSIIYAGHQGCKMAWGSIGLIRDVCKEMNKPLLVFFMDSFHGQAVAASEIKSTLEGFFKTIGVV